MSTAAERAGDRLSRDRAVGFAALGAEVVWTRLLSLLFGSTVYTFAIILAVFLAGLGIGSTLAARWVQRIEPAAVVAGDGAAGDRVPRTRTRIS